MKKIVVSSMRSNAGKTSIIAGIISLMKDKKFAYAKPLGDRLIYRKKRSWDYDASLMINLLERKGELEDHLEKITLGFDHSRLRYMYDQDGIKKALSDIVKDIGGANDVLFIESGRDLASGASLNLDPVSVAQSIDGTLVIVLSGEIDCVHDDIKFLEEYIKIKDIHFGGIILNKIKDIDDFENECGADIKKTGIEIIGVIPYKTQLTEFTVDFLAERLLAKVIAGENNLKNIVKNIIIGKPMIAAQNQQLLSTKPGLREEKQLVITGGDKSDTILAAMERDTAGIIITNNIVPPRNIISRANEKGIPILLVPMDTFKTAQTIDDMDVLLRKDDKGKIELLSQLIEKHTRMKDFLK